MFDVIKYLRFSPIFSIYAITRKSPICFLLSDSQVRLTSKWHASERRARQNSQAQNDSAVILASLGQYAVTVAKHSDRVDGSDYVPVRWRLVLAGRRKGLRTDIRRGRVSPSYEHKRQCHGDQTQNDAQYVRGQEARVRRNNSKDEHAHHAAQKKGTVHHAVPVAC